MLNGIFSLLLCTHAEPPSPHHNPRAAEQMGILNLLLSRMGYMVWADTLNSGETLEGKFAIFLSFGAPRNPIRLGTGLVPKSFHLNGCLPALSGEGGPPWHGKVVGVTILAVVVVGLCARVRPFVCLHRSAFDERVSVSASALWINVLTAWGRV